MAYRFNDNTCERFIFFSIIKKNHYENDPNK